MIYDWFATIICCGYEIRHFVRAMVCKDYYTESHGLGMCGASSKTCFCEYRWCPKRKGR